MTANKLKITSLIDDTVELNRKVIKYIANHFLSCPEDSKKRPALIINDRLYNRASIGRAGKNIVSIFVYSYSDYNKKIILSTSSISRIKPTLDSASGDKGIIMDIHGKKSIVKLVYIV